VVKSSLKAEKSLMKLGGKALKSKGDDALKLVDNKIDDVGRSLIDDTAGGAKGISSEVTGVSQKYLGCFAAGTPIQTPSGSKPIEEFVPGDWVLAQDESDPDAVPTLRQVEEVFENQAQVMVLGLGGREIETTPEHPFWVRDKGWTAAGEIETGDELRSHDGQWIPLDSKLLADNIVTVYNMRVAEDHTYFVGSPLWGFTVWAHNACKYTPNGINLSDHAASESLKRHKFKSPYKDVDDIVRNAQWHPTQADGAIVHLYRQPTRSKLYSMVIVNPNTNMLVTALRNLDGNALRRLSANYEFPLPW
jgi:hypothetical protein